MVDSFDEDDLTLQEPDADDLACVQVEVEAINDELTKGWTPCSVDVD